jgi:DNA-binding NarL/FixJ family response regulator
MECSMAEPTPRQVEIGKLIAQGYTGQEIAEQLGLTLQTVNTHRSALFQAVGVHNAVELVHYAVRNRWIKVGEVTRR